MSTILTLTVHPKNEEERDAALGQTMAAMTALVSQGMLVSIHINDYDEDED